MRVLLKRNWYTKRRRLYLKGEHDFPESVRDHLPSSAEILDDEPEQDEFAEDAWMAEANGVSVDPGKNGWYTLNYTDEDGEAVSVKVQGEEDAKAKAEELRG